MENVQSPQLLSLIISFVVGIAVTVGVLFAFLNFLFNRIDKRFESYETLLTAKLGSYPTKEDIYELKNQMSNEHATLARKVDDLNALLQAHIEDTKLHSASA